MTHARFRNAGVIPVVNTRAPNDVCSFDNFFISFNPVVADYGCATTAIVFNHNAFLILCGDHADNLRDAADRDGVSGVVGYFIDNLNQAHDAGDHLRIAGVLSDPFNTVTYFRDSVPSSVFDTFVNAVQGDNRP